MNIEVTIKVPLGRSAESPPNIDGAGFGEIASAEAQTQRRALSSVEFPPLEGESDGPSALSDGLVETEGATPPPGLDEFEFEGTAAAPAVVATGPPPSLEQIESWTAGTSSLAVPPVVEHFVHLTDSDSRDASPPTLEELKVMSGRAKRRKKGD